MTDLESRVSQCFRNVFPGVDAGELPQATQATLAQWDSVAHVTLLTAIGEEFQIDLDDDSFEALTSYPLILRFVEKSVQAQ